jgi:hypothetical protein
MSQHCHKYLLVFINDMLILSYYRELGSQFRGISAERSQGAARQYDGAGSLVDQILESKARIEAPEIQLPLHIPTHLLLNYRHIEVIVSRILHSLLVSIFILFLKVIVGNLYFRESIE